MVRDGVQINFRAVAGGKDKGLRDRWITFELTEQKVLLERVNKKLFPDINGGGFMVESKDNKIHCASITKVMGIINNLGDFMNSVGGYNFPKSQ